MKKNKTLLLVNNISIIDKLKEREDVTFLFPVKDFSIGHTNTFDISEIKIDGYIFLNRILNNEDIKKLREILKSLPENIKGIVFDDVGVLNVLLELDLPITKILFLNHLNCNYESVIAYLEYVDSVVVSPDITITEIEEILEKASKPLVIFTFGYVNIMYSRRTLLTNYNDEFKRDVPLKSILEEEISHQNFKIVENDYGTVIYPNCPFNGLVLRDKKNVLYNLVNTLFLSDEEVLKIIDSETNLEEEYPYKYLSDKKMIVKLKEEAK